MRGLVRLKTVDNHNITANLTYIFEICNVIVSANAVNIKTDISFFEDMLGFKIDTKNQELARILTRGMILEQRPELFRKLKRAP